MVQSAKTQAKRWWTQRGLTMTGPGPSVLVCVAVEMQRFGIRVDAGRHDVEDIIARLDRLAEAVKSS